ncbi:unnamed protein product [Sphagnum balticum]
MTLITEARSDPRCFNFTIESLLNEPVHRVPRYKLLLEQLLKRTVKEFMFWLFSDKLLYGELLTGMTSNSNCYNLNRIIPLHECRITDNADTGRIAPVWLPDSAVTNCQDCAESFTVIRRKHHCRHWYSVCIPSSHLFIIHLPFPYFLAVCSGGSPRAGSVKKSRGQAGSFDLQTFLKYRSAVLDEIDPNRISAVRRRDDDDITPGHNCCNVCVNEFSMFKTKQTCMNCDCNRNKFLVPHVDPKNEVRVCKTCYIKLAGGLSYEPFEQPESNTGSTLGAIKRKSVFLKNAVFSGSSGPIMNTINADKRKSVNSAKSASSTVSTASVVPGSTNSTALAAPAPISESKALEAAGGYSNYFDFSAFIHARYAVLDQIAARSRAFSLSVSFSRGNSTSSGAKGSCRCCNKDYNKIKNLRSECKNWCVACTALVSSQSVTLANFSHMQNPQRNERVHRLHPKGGHRAVHQQRQEVPSVRQVLRAALLEQRQ